MSAPSPRDKAIATICRAFAPPPDLAPSDWVERHRILDAGAALPGRWRWDATPYFREPLDCLSPSSPVRTVAVVAGAQLGKTELLLNALAYWIANDPKPIMAVWPSLDVAKRVANTRIEPMIALVPEVKARIVPQRSRERGNTTLYKKIIGGSDLIITGANAPAPLRSSPINFALIDEVSAMEETSEGDVLDLVAARQYTYPHTKKTLLTSTPRDEGTCIITRAYLETDQRKYFVPCLQCDHRWVIGFGDIQYPEGQPERAALVCPECGRPHDEFEKPEHLRRGEWRPTVTGADPTKAGFWISGIYSPWLKYSEITTKHRLVAKDPPRLRVFVNTILAEPWVDLLGGKTIDPTTISARGESGDWANKLPRPVVVLTASVDTQGDRLELEVVGWGKGEESWSIEHRRLDGDPSRAEVWHELDVLLARTFAHSLAVPDLPIAAVCIDTGGNNTSMVYNYVRGKERRNVWGIKGSNRPGAPVWPRRPSRKNKGRIPLYFVGSSAAKEQVYQRLEIPAPGPGYMHFPSDRSDAYFRQLTAETMKKVRKRGKTVLEFDAGGRRNEALDLKAYNLAALQGLYLLGFDLDAAAATMASQPERESGRPAVILPRRQTQVKSSFFYG